jgi:hypothetical protein
MRPRCWVIGKISNAIAGLLATQLTDLERQYLHKRIAEEYFQLKRLEKSPAETASRRSHDRGGCGEAHRHAIRAERAIRLFSARQVASIETVRLV